jgi:hypothetical protein
MNFFKALGGGWSEEGVSLMMEKYPFQKSENNRPRPVAAATCVSVVQKRPVERGPRGAAFWDGWLHFPKSESGMCVPDLPPLWKCEIVHFWTVRITQRGVSTFSETSKRRASLYVKRVKYFSF